jgi:hypothetical protein
VAQLCLVRPVTASKSRAYREGHASNEEARMTNDEGMTKHECNVLAFARTHARNRISEVFRRGRACFCARRRHEARPTMLV